MNCPCGLKYDYTDCCLPLHTKKRQAETAEQLMRSRYSAFVMQELDYLKDTMTADFSKQKTKIWLKKIVWKKLTILAVEQGQMQDTAGCVKFKADYTENKEKKSMIEDSYFEKINDKWLYLGERNAKLLQQEQL